MKNYLTEKRLGEILNELLPNNDFVHNKPVPNMKNKRLRPDYRSDDLMIVIEFDGYQHYTKPKQMLNDVKKDIELIRLGYAVHRIPYFIQMTDDLLFEIFGKRFGFVQEYPHGFIDKKCVLPAEFCELGMTRFVYEIYRNKIMESIFYDSIEHSIWNKIVNEHDGNWLMVIPRGFGLSFVDKDGEQIITGEERLSLECFLIDC